jgi:hypothetical protein
VYVKAGGTLWTNVREPFAVDNTFGAAKIGNCGLTGLRPCGKADASGVSLGREIVEFLVRSIAQVRKTHVFFCFSRGS